MPQTMTVTAPNGKSLTISGDRVPTETELQDIFAKAGVETQPPPTDPNTVGTFASHVGAQLDPRSFGQAVLPQSMGGTGIVQTVRNIGQAQGDLLEKAKASYAAGDKLTAARHFVDYLLPLIGPVLDKSADSAQQGHYAASAGDAVGLGLSMFGPQAVSEAATALRTTKPAQAVADAAQKGAVNRAVDVMAPQVGPNKVRFGNQVAKAAPDVLRQTSALTKGGLQTEVANNLDAAHGALDAAYDAVPNTRMYPTAPIIKSLQDAKANLQVSGIGGKVTPAVRAARVGAIDQAIDEVKGLGSLVNADNLRNLKGAWGEGAKAVFTPAIAPDALKLKSAGAGWADANTALTNFLVDKHPELKPLNADVSLWTKASDAMQAAEEADRVRPKVGRTIMARGLGAAAGGAEGGGIGAAVGAVVGPLIESGLTALSPTRKLFVARQLQALSDALRSGQATKAQALVNGLRKTLPAAPVLRLVPSSAPGSVLPAAAQDQSAATP